MRQIILCLTCLLSASAGADLTIDGNSSPGLNGGIDRFTMYLMDEQLRVDRLITKNIDGQDVDTVDSSILVRFTGEPAGVLFLDHGARKVKVVAAMNAVSAGQQGSVSPATITRTDETREILGRTARRFNFSFNGSIDPMALVGQQVSPDLANILKVNLAVTGSSWVVPGMQGEQEFAGFMQKMAENEMTIGLAGGAQQGAGGQAGLISPELSSGLKDVMSAAQQIRFAGANHDQLEHVGRVGRPDGRDDAGHAGRPRDRR